MGACVFIVCDRPHVGRYIGAGRICLSPRQDCSAPTCIQYEAMKRDWPIFLRKLLGERYYRLKHRWDCLFSLCDNFLANFFRRVLQSDGIIREVWELERIDATSTSTIEGARGRFPINRG